eukprot:805635-Prorocentrum_minimum.AAC.1
MRAAEYATATTAASAASQHINEGPARGPARRVAVRCDALKRSRRSRSRAHRFLALLSPAPSLRRRA